MSSFPSFWRSRFSIINDQIFAIYYSDTIYDMMMNIIGGFVGFAILKWKT